MDARIKCIKLLNISKKSPILHYKFIKYILLYYDYLYDISNNYNMLNIKNINFITSYDINIYITSLLDTYSSNETLIRQFIVDFNRQTIYVNNVLINDYKTFIKTIGKYNRILTFKKQISLLILSIALSCQSSFYIQYKHIYDKINMMHLKNKLTKHIYVVDYKEKNIIRFYVDDNIFKCSLTAFHQIMDTENVKTIYTYQSETLFDSNIDNCLFIYNNR
jgi:hypothetical protein